MVIAKSIKKDKRNNQYWVCKCDCGNIKDIRGFHLQEKPGTKSCGCLNKLSKGESAFNVLYGRYKRRALDKELSFRLTKKNFKSLTKQNCFYCDAIPNQIVLQQRQNGSYIYNGIDRLDNNKGYTKDNCVSCCGKCNKMKLAMSFSGFKEQIDRIYFNLTVVD